MNRQETAHALDCSSESQVLYMAMELSKKKWKLALSKGHTKKPRIFDLETGDVEGVRQSIRIAAKRLLLPDDVRVMACHEAGRDGFWIHRALVELGVESIVVDPASIETGRQKKKRKTDRLDVRKLLRKLISYSEGDKEVWSVVQVPLAEDEDRRRRSREMERLRKERTGHCARISSLLATVGLQIPAHKDFLSKFEEARQWNGEPLLPHLEREVRREYARLSLVEEQMDELTAEIRGAVRASETSADFKVMKLAGMKGINLKGAVVLVDEAFGIKQFKNRKHAGSFTGLTGTPYDSGESETDQGINKIGNRRIRRVLTQLAWLWLQHQPDSYHSQWFQERFGGGGSRTKRIGIVGLARRLFIMLWRYVEQDVTPDDVVFKTKLDLR